MDSNKDSEALNSSDHTEAEYLDMDYEENHQEDPLSPTMILFGNPDVDDEPLIRFRATTILKDFKGQRSNEVGDTFDFAGDTVEEILKSIWEVARNFCYRALVFSNSRRISGSTKLEYDVEWSSKGCSRYCRHGKLHFDAGSGFQKGV